MNPHLSSSSNQQMASFLQTLDTRLRAVEHRNSALIPQVAGVPDPTDLEPGQTYVTSAGDVHVITDTGVIPLSADTTIPNPPTSLSANSTSLDPQGLAQVIVGWTPPTQNTDGSLLTDLYGYLVDFRYTALLADYQPAVIVTTNTVTLVGLATNQPITVRVRSEDRYGHLSTVATYNLTTARDTTPPPSPSTPTLASAIGGIAVTWNGKDASGASMPADWQRTDVYLNTTNSFATAVPFGSFLNSLGGTNVIDLPDFSTRYVWLLAVDQSGNPSLSPSTSASAAARQIGNPDLGANIVKATNLAASAVTAAAIANSAVTAAAIAASSVTSGAIAASAVTSLAIAGSAVTSAAIAANAVTGPAIAASAVTAGKIAANAVTAVTIAASSVTASAIAASSVWAGALQASSVVAGNIAASAVVAGNIAASAVTAVTIAASAVTAGDIAASAVTAGTIAASAVSTINIVASSITASTIAAGAIQASKLSATQAQIPAGGILVAGGTESPAGSGTYVGARVTFDSTGLRAYTNVGGTSGIAANDILALKIDTTGITLSGSISAPTGSITGASLIGGTITGALISTSVSGGRLELDGPNNRFRIYATDGTTVLTELNSTSSTLTGIVQTGASGARAQLNPSVITPLGTGPGLVLDPGSASTVTPGSVVAFDNSGRPYTVFSSPSDLDYSHSSYLQLFGWPAAPGSIATGAKLSTAGLAFELLTDGGDVWFSGNDATTIGQISTNVGWTSPTLANGWTNFGSTWQTAQYTRLVTGEVVCRGLITAGTTTLGTRLFTLAAGYRPAADHVLYALAGGGVICRIDVHSDGTVTLGSVPSNTYLSLDNIRFAAAPRVGQV